MTRTIRIFPWLLLPLGLGVVLWGASADARDDQNDDKDEREQMEDRAARYTGAWPERPREVANQMIEKYGLPDESTQTMLIWHNERPWKRIILHREEIPHNFPKPHVDILEQFIDYRVPPDKFDELAYYNGSIIAERTRGEISVRCENEAANFLALNLAHDVVQGEKDVKTARQEYARAAEALMRGEGPEYTRKLQFERQRDTADPDMAMKKHEEKSQPSDDGKQQP